MLRIFRLRRIGLGEPLDQTQGRCCVVRFNQLVGCRVIAVGIKGGFGNNLGMTLIFGSLIEADCVKVACRPNR